MRPYLPVEDRDTSLRNVETALRQIGQRIHRGSPNREILYSPKKPMTRFDVRSDLPVLLQFDQRFHGDQSFALQCGRWFLEQILSDHINPIPVELQPPSGTAILLRYAKLQQRGEIVAAAHDKFVDAAYITERPSWRVVHSARLGEFISTRTCTARRSVSS